MFLGTLDRGRFAPWGLFQGGEGGKGALVVNAGAPGERRLGSKVAGVRLDEGDAITIVTPGAGGYGSPIERSAALLARDLREGKVSPGVARAVYRVSSPSSSSAARSQSGGRS